MPVFSLHSKIRHTDRFGSDLNKSRQHSILKAMKNKNYRLLYFDNVRNRVLEFPTLGLTAVYSDIARKVVTLWPTNSKARRLI